MPEGVVLNHTIGVLILGRKRPGFDQEWNRVICGRSVAALEGLGFRCVGQDAPVIDDATLAVALKQVEAAGAEALLMLQPSMGNGQLALSLSQLWKGPILLWATPERPGDGKVSSCSLVGQHLWSSTLRQSGHPFELVYGDPDDARVKEELVRAFRLARTVTQMRTAKVGVIGTHAPGFIDLAADPFLLRRTFGLQMHPLSLLQFVDRVNRLDASAVRKDVDRVRELGLPLVEVTEDDLAMNSRCYLAVLELMQEESLTALSIQCWPELPEVLGQWPYLAISRLTTEGRAVSMEGDVDGAIAELMGNTLGLGNAFLTDWLEHDDNTVLLWHPGMAPLSLCCPVGGEDGPSLGKHFNIVKPLVVDGRLQPGKPATIMRLWHCDNRYMATAMQGTTVKAQRSITGNSIEVEVSGGQLRRRFDDLIHEGLPHHVLLYYGHCAETFRRFARLTGIDWVHGE